MIKIGNISIDESEIAEEFIRAGGPGGQHVNKAATAVQLRFDVLGSPSLPMEVKEKLLRISGAKATGEGTIVITARRFRSREKNREDALERLREMILVAVTPVKKRRKTAPTKASKARRIEEKHKKAGKKEMRKKVRDEY